MDCMTLGEQVRGIGCHGGAEAQTGVGGAYQAATERRMSRIGMDLHDGPLQDMSLLRGELSALHGCLTGIDPADFARAAPECAEKLIAKVDGLLAIAEAAETELRELSRSLESTSLMTRPLEESLRGIVRSFALRTGIEPELQLDGDASGLTKMERGTLLRVIGEALANAREHGAPRSIAVSVKVGSDRVMARVVDDGRGFDLERKLPESIERGSLGLVGMIERARLLGGACRINSRPGQGTAVTVSFARYLNGRGADRTPRALSAWAAAAQPAA